MTMVCDIELPAAATLRAFDVPGPRYTSYPTADRFVDAFDADAHAHWLGQRAAKAPPQPLSVYVHLPFCNTVCFYCGCNKIVTKDLRKAGAYLDAVDKELRLVDRRLGGSRELTQLHLGGGTPTFFSIGELERLMQMLTDVFTIAPNAELGVEVDPRSAPADKMQALARLGFNRVSIGVQDIDHDVQVAVNRIQPFDVTAANVEAARAAGFASINIDLIYGLPRQTRPRFARTLQRVLELDPDRVALYSYAHLPERFKPQRRIRADELPPPEEKAGLLREAIGCLTAAGYRYIGMDHFAKADDALAVAQQRGQLHRNFQGYSTQPDCDLIGLGVSAISRIGPTYAQNARELDDYVDRVDNQILPTVRGVLLNVDDLARRAVIMALMCHFEVSKEAIAIAHLLDFDRYFAAELEALRRFEDDGLVETSDEWIGVTPKGKLLVRAIAMVFDRYLRGDERIRKYSKIV